MGSDKSFILAIDGPAASGKGTLARMLSKELGLPHLDTGLTFRAVAYELLQQNQPLDDEVLAIKAAQNLDLGAMDRTVLADHEIGNAASKIAVMSGVREVLKQKQRAFANQDEGAILDGRDIGTVICPDADLKLYVIADAEIRAERRYKEILDKEIPAAGETADLEQILADIIARDERDMGRSDSPLKPAEDAHLLDTSRIDIESAFKLALDLVNRAKSA
jgi:cytidylate kinase